MTDAAFPCLAAPLSDAHVAGLLEQDKGNEAKASSTVRDSFQNFAAGLGLGTDNVASASSYGFNPITRNRVLLEWIHRGNWLGGLAVEVVAEDMTREGIDYIGEIPPQDQARISQAIAELDVWASLCSGVKWGRLYGGAGCVIMIDGQDPSTPLDVTKVGPGQFRGLLPLDRWTVQPVLSQLIDRPGPDLGLPQFYQITATAGLPAWTIHHSRFIRFIGIELPYYQRVYELLWGLSIFERLFDRLVAFDSATQGAAQLVYKSYLRVLKLKGFREAVSAGGPATQGVLNSLKLNNYYQSIEGMSLIDAEDNLEIHGHQAFGGLAEALVHFGQQLSGALQIPLVRLFGQSPAGLNSTGDSDLKTYYDGIRNQQMRMLKSGAQKIYQCCAASLGIRLPADFDLSFKSLWQMTEPEKAQVAAQDSATVVAVWQTGLIKAAVALMELKQLSRLTGRFTNITDEDIAAAREVPPAAPGGVARDHLSAAWDAVWKSEEHPRGYHGRFIEKTGAGGSPPLASGSLPVPAGTGAPPPLPSTPPSNWNIWQHLNPISSARAESVPPVATVEPEEIREEYRPPENFQPSINRPYYVSYAMSELNKVAQARYDIAINNLRQIEPNNPILTQPILTNIRQSGSVPSHETSERIEEEVTAARARAALRLFGGGGGPNWTQTRPDPSFEAWARGVLAKLQPAPGQGVVGPEGPEIIPEPAQGVVISNKFEDHELAFATDIAAYTGGKVIEPPQRGFPGIDGWVVLPESDAEIPISLKETQGGLVSVLRSASQAEAEASVAGYSNVLVYIKAPNVDSVQLQDFGANGGLSIIPTQGTVSSINVLTQNGTWIVFGGKQ